MDRRCERVLGFSTGALARGDFRKALRWLSETDTRAVELSALRASELPTLINALPELDLSAFDYVSIHAPSRFDSMTEETVVTLLEPVRERGWPVIAHPDSLTQDQLWQRFGELLCLENMDKRKQTGRTRDELRHTFERFPNASWCFDIGHVRQVDPTMCEAVAMLRELGDRLRQIHISEVTASSRHEAISYTAMRSFRKVADLIPTWVPAILESPIGRDGIPSQLAITAAALERRGRDSGSFTSGNGACA